MDQKNVDRVIAEAASSASAPSFYRNDLSDLVFDCLDLSRAVFYRATLRRVDARGTVFDDATLFRACLMEADLRRASFKRACLVFADFTVAALAGADFTDADLRGARFDGAIIGDAIFTRAKLSDDAPAEVKARARLSE